MSILAWEPAVMDHPIDGVRLPELPGDEIARACRLHEQVNELGMLHKYQWDRTIRT